jgi:hypothetical protein
MTELQQVLFRLEADYYGHPYHVTGHALFNALARRVNAATRQALCVSHGVFVPGEHGAYPETHPRSDGVPYFGTGLRPVETYDDLFLFRDPVQPWLADDRPRDAHNSQPLRSHGGRRTVGPTRWFGRPPDAHNSRRSMTWYVHCYLHVDTGSETAAVQFPLDEAVLDELRVGGGRNFGFGELSLKDTQVVALSDIEYPRLRNADAYVLELVSPYVLASEYPGAEAQSVPWWWAVPGDVAGDGLRRRETQLAVGDTVHAVETVDHGQVVWYDGSDPVATARNGLVRVGTHSKYGFGELRVRPAADVAVPAAPGVDETPATTGGDR